MTDRRKLIVAACMVPTLTGLQTAPVWAHGDAQKPGKPFTKVKKEQKPWGIAGDVKNVRRSMAVGMDDNMRFTPDKMVFRQGETVRFVASNKGKILHEFVLGTKNELDEHAALMLKFPSMEHDEPYMAHVPPGKTGQIIWTFNRAGDFEFACLIAGHYQAGMKGTIRVTATA
jgi:uncharacterized cupredoxin-like copper-binding protein